MDPDVSDGSLADLSHNDAIAVVAIYQRGLGFGDYMVGPHALDGRQLDGTAETLLINAAPESVEEVRAGLADLQINVLTPSEYATAATATGAAEQRLSTVLLLALLAFVFLAAANTLVMVTARRRPELQLYGRTGATRTQLVTMAAIEATLTGGLAWIIGTLAVAPAVLGVGFGMLGATVPAVDLTAYLALSTAVLVLPFLTVVPIVIRTVRPARTGAR